MKKLLTFLMFFLLATAMAQMQAEEKTVTLGNWASKPIAGEAALKVTGTLSDGGNNNWNVVLTGKDATKNPSQNVTSGYWQLGANGNMVTAVFSTSAISGTIKDIKVKCAAYQGKGLVTVKVGGKNFGTEKTMAAWSNNQGSTLSFSGSATGDIAVTMEATTDTGRAIYLSSITVTYEDNEDPDPDPTPDPSGDGVTYNFSNFTSASPVTFNGNGFTITMVKGDNSTSNPAWTSNEARLYAGGTIVVNSTTKQIIKVVYDYNINANKSGTVPDIDGVTGSTSIGTWDANSKTWTGEDYTVTLSTSGTAGNLGFKSITVYFKESDPTPSGPSIEAESALNLTAAEGDGTFNVTWTNAADMEVNLYTDESCTTTFTGSWFQTQLNKSDNNVYYIADANAELTPRTVYMQLYAVGEDGESTATKVVTVTQAGKDPAPLAVITAESTLSVPYAGVEDGTFNVTWTNAEDMDVNLYTDESCTTTFTGDWFAAEINKDDNNVYYIAEDNAEHTSRTVYMQLMALNADEIVTTKVVTVTQEAPAVTYTVTFTQPENGAISVKHGDDVVNSGDKFAKGEKLTVTATPNEGYKLSELLINDHKFNSPKEWTMGEENVTISATFAALYTITINENITNGTVTADKAEAAAGEEVTLTVTPAEHYSLESLTVAGASGEVNVTDGKFTMPAEAVTVSATFVEDAKYTVTIETPANGTLVVKDGETALESGAQVYTGTTLTIECTPAAGYQYKNWQYKEGEKTWATRTTGMTLEVKDNVSIRANFEVIPTYTIAWYEDGIEKQKDANKLDGDAVTAYEVQSEINGKKFVGKWMKNVEIIEPQDEVPAYVDAPTTANATTAGNYYAVYATETGGQGGTGTEQLANETIASYYGTGSSSYDYRTIGNWSGKFNISNNGDYTGIGLTHQTDDTKANYGSYLLTPNFSGPVKSIRFKGYDASKAAREIILCDEYKAEAKTSDAAYGWGQIPAGEGAHEFDVTISVTGAPTQMYIKAGTGAIIITDITVTYAGGGSVTYSGYTTRPANTAKVESIELSNKTTEFYVDDEFVKATVTAHLDDNTTKDVTNVATFTGYHMTQVGTQTVTVTYLDKTATYDIVVKPQVAAPVFNLEPGTYEGTSKKVGISCETTGAKIYYTMTPDVTVPTLYTKQLDVTGETTIVAYAMVGDGSGKRTSESATAEYKLVSVFAPAISPKTKTSDAPVAVTITQNSNLTGAKTYVKINNGEAQLYKNAFVVTSTSTVEAYTVAGENESSHVSETYTITAAPTPGEPVQAMIKWKGLNYKVLGTGTRIKDLDTFLKTVDTGSEYIASYGDYAVESQNEGNVYCANESTTAAISIGATNYGAGRFTLGMKGDANMNVSTLTIATQRYGTAEEPTTINVYINGKLAGTAEPAADTKPGSQEEGKTGAETALVSTFTFTPDEIANFGTLENLTFTSNTRAYINYVNLVGTTATPVPATGDFKLVTSTDDLVAGREYIVVSKPGDAIYGLSIDNADAHGVGSDGEAKTTKNWRRAETGVTLSENFYTATLEEGSKVSVLTLGGNTNEWRFNSANGYLVKGATSSAETYLPMLLAANGNETFSVNVRFDNVAELHFNGAADNRRIKWFSNPADGVNYPRFGNYVEDNKNYNEVYLYWREANNEVTLGELEANGIEDNDKVYTITDDLVVFKVVGNTAWAHDMAKSYAYRENTYDATWYGGYNADSYTQHNWVMLTFPEGTDMNEVENHQLSNVKGTYHGHKGVSHEIVVSSFGNAAIAEENSVSANTYNMASFWDDNTYDYVTVLGKNFFFMNPKIEEVCHITEAVWNGTGFVVPANQTVEEVHLNSGDLKGGVKVNWAYNEEGAPAKIGADRYNFLAVVTKNASAHAAGGAGAPAKVAPSDCGLTDYVVYPLDFTVTNNIVTEVKDVDVAGREVKSVRFYDIAGRARSEAQPGINIVVTEYTDGTHSTAKMVR